MGLFQKALDTFNNMEHLAGTVKENHITVLAPISHITVMPSIQITLDSNGNLVKIESFAHDSKKKTKIVIPATEDSSGRSVVPAPHGLCDQIGYISEEIHEKHTPFMEQLERWVKSEHNHPKANAVLEYLKKNTVTKDLEKVNLIVRDEKGRIKNEKDLICWSVIGLGLKSGPCWTDIELMKCFKDYYLSEINSRESVLCLISGSVNKPAQQHLKGVCSSSGNAKLISSNDSTNFTYRGRFTESSEALTVGYDSSQKSHNALKWLIEDQGKTIGGKTYVCWNSKGYTVPSVTDSLLSYDSDDYATPTNYRDILSRKILGYKTDLPDGSDVVIAAFEAATTGRLSVVYYNELESSDFLSRLTDWDRSCCFNRWNGESNTVCSPPLRRIAEYAFGTQRGDEKPYIELDDRVLSQQIGRLISCRVDRIRIPKDIVMAIVNKTSRLLNYSEYNRRELLFIACSLIRKKFFDYNGEELQMALEPEKKDRSYQFGRLLAVLEKIETDTYQNREKESRVPNAIRIQSVFSQRPLYASKMLIEQLKTAYYPQLKAWQRNRYDKLISEIFEQLSFYSETELTRPLNELYLIGYNLQRSALYTSNKNKENTEEDENESIEE